MKTFNIHYQIIKDGQSYRSSYIVFAERIDLAISKGRESIKKLHNVNNVWIQNIL